MAMDRPNPVDKSLHGEPRTRQSGPSHAHHPRRPGKRYSPITTEPRRWAEQLAAATAPQGANGVPGNTDQRPVIGINCDIKTQGNTEYCFVPDAYLACLHMAGAEIIALPPYGSAPLAMLDGLVMIGGRDLDPRPDGYQLHAQHRLMHPRREAFDRWLVAKARQRKLPLLGIGAGAQTLNVVLGGTLSYHIPADYPRAIPHAEPADPYHGHMVMLREGSLLAHVYPAGLVAYVRSQHHQAVDDVAPGLCATAWDAANIVEAIERRIPG